MSRIFKVSATGHMMTARGIFRRRIGARSTGITLAGMPDDQPILLRKIYVPLVLTPQAVSEHVDEEEIHEGGRTIEEWCARFFRDPDAGDPNELLEDLSRPLTLLQKQHGLKRILLISGEAGSGKTTLTHSVVASLCGEAPDPFNRYFEPWLPVPVMLRETPIRLLDDLDALMDWWLKRLAEPEDKNDTADLDLDQLKRFLDRGHAFLLFDGLDELGGVEPRQRFLETLQKHRWVTGDTPNFVFLTGRPSGYADLGDALHRMPGLRLHVAPFSKPQIETYLTRWFDLRPTRVGGEQRRAVEQLMERLTAPDQKLRLLAMARRPAYLAALAFVHGTRGQLPHTRAELYRLLVEAYLEILDQQRGLLQAEDGSAKNWSRQDKIQVLSTVAMIAHDGATDPEAKKEPSDDDRRFSWSREELEATVRSAIAASAERLRDIQPDDHEDLTAYFIARTGLLAETREKVFQFNHLSFQEYLAALFLLDAASAAENKGQFLAEVLLNDRLQRSGWHEVALLLLAEDGSRTQNVGHRQVLQHLDPGKEHHFELLTRVLAGHEVQLSTEERRAWLFTWYAAAAVYGRIDAARTVGQLEGNDRLLEEAWELACVGLAEHGLRWSKAFSEALKKLAAEVEATQKKEKASAGGVASVLALQKSGREQHWMRIVQQVFGRVRESETADDAVGAILLPARASVRPENLGSSLIPALAHDDLASNLFQEVTEVSHQIPTLLWWAFESWSWSDVSLAQELMGKTRLAFALAHITFFDRALFEPESSSESGRLAWLQQSAGQNLSLERVWCVRQLVFNRSEGFWKQRETARVRVQAAQALARTRAWVPGPALAGTMALAALALARVLQMTRARARARARARDLTRTLKLEMDLARDMKLNLNLDLNHDPDLALALELDLNKETKQLFLESATTLKEHPLLRDDDSEHRERAVLLLSWTFAALGNGGMLNDGAGRITYEETRRRLEPLRDAEAMTRDIEDPALREQAKEEWEELLGCEWSPVPLIDDLLASPWTELDVSPEAIVRAFAERVRELVDDYDGRAAE